MLKAVFLDRDGTINDDPGYLRHPDQMILLGGAAKALARLKAAGFKLVVVSNQSGVARGLILLEDIPRIHARMDELLDEQGVKIDHYELCFHRPEEDCACRKPKPKLIMDAARKMGIDLSESFMIGDKRTDILAGLNAGCRGSILVRTGHGEEDQRSLKTGEAAYVADDLAGAVDWLLKNIPG